MRQLRWLLMCGTLLICSNVSAQTDPANQVRALVKSFYAAEQAYDPNALRGLIDEQYVEISPAGEVDAHDRFLGFYAPDQKTEWPPMTLTDEQVRVFGDTAVEIAKISYAMKAADGTPRTLEVRVTFIAHRVENGWKLLGAQFTGIRPVPPKK